MYWIIDFAIVAIIVLCLIRGYRRGLVLAVFSALTLVVALGGAFLLSRAFSHHLEALVEPPIANWVNTRIERHDININIPMTEENVHETLRTLGINEGLTNRIEDTVNTQLQRAGYAFQNAVTSALASAVAHVLTFLIAFIALMIGLKFTARLLDTIARLPLLNTVNKLGGAAGGLLQGVVIIWLSVTALRFVGVIGADILESSFWLRMFFS